MLSASSAFDAHSVNALLLAHVEHLKNSASCILFASDERARGALEQVARAGAFAGRLNFFSSGDAGDATASMAASIAALAGIEPHVLPCLAIVGAGFTSLHVLPSASLHTARADVVHAWCERTLASPDAAQHVHSEARPPGDSDLAYQTANGGNGSAKARDAGVVRIVAASFAECVLDDAQHDALFELSNEWNAACKSIAPMVDEARDFRLHNWHASDSKQKFPTCIAYLAVVDAQLAHI